jgi:TQXA domain-containing protein/LPXTG-motif cell wall-anchored protein
MPRALRGVALTGAAAIMLAVAAPASADPATGKADPATNRIGYQVNVGEDWLATLPTNLLGFKLSDGTALLTYCVEIYTDIDESEELVEQPWDEYPDKDSPFHANRTKINSVLHNGYPHKSLEQLTAAVPGADNGIDELEAIAATQAAVWHFSDGTDLNRTDPLPGDGSDEADAKDTLALYDLLVGSADSDFVEIPLTQFEILPNQLTGKSGTRIGPFQVKTTAEVKAIKADLPAGVRVTDAAGTELAASAIKNGTELFLDVPAAQADGKGGFELTAEVNIETGRLFVGKNYATKPTQSMIVAQTKTVTLTATANGAWGATQPPPTSETTTTAPPTTTVPPATTSTTRPDAAPVADEDDLASTGASVFTPIVIGIVLVGAGIGALLVMRRRRRV